MGFTLSSFFASSAALALMLAIVNFMLRDTAIILKYGVISVYSFILLILLRGCLPYDFYSINLTASFYSYKILPFFQTLSHFKIKLFHFTLTLEMAVLFFWIMGGMLFTSKKIYGYFAFRKYLYRLSFCKDQDIIKICRQVFYSIFSQRRYKIRIVQSDTIGSPAIFGFFSPVIILPDIPYTEEELRFIFRHELIHYKHYDFFVKVMADLLTAIHWWNPLIRRYLLHIVNQVQELYVDYEVKERLTKSEKLIYLQVLSKTMEHIYKSKSDTRNVFALADKRSGLSMRQRLNCIIDSNGKGLTLRGFGVNIFLFILSLAFIFEPSFAPEWDELGEPVFYADEKESYYIWDGENYELYLSGDYVYTYPKVHDHFKKLPIYNQEDL